jgi:hypothetical protein
VRYLFSALVFAWVLACPLTADDAPVLTDQQRLIVQNRVLAVQLAQSQLELVLRDLRRDGYDIDLTTITYVKKAEKGP